MLKYHQFEFKTVDSPIINLTNHLNIQEKKVMTFRGAIETKM